MLKVRYKARCCKCEAPLVRGSYVMRDPVSGGLHHIDCDEPNDLPIVEEQLLHTELYGIECH